MNTTVIYLLEKTPKAAALALGMFAMTTPFNGWQFYAFGLMVTFSVSASHLTKSGWYAFPSGASIQVKFLLGLCLGPMKVLATLFAVQTLWMLVADPFFSDRTMALMLIVAVLLHELAMMLTRFGRWQQEGRP